MKRVYQTRGSSVDLNMPGHCLQLRSNSGQESFLKHRKLRFAKRAGLNLKQSVYPSMVKRLPHQDLTVCCRLRVLAIGVRNVDLTELTDPLGPKDDPGDDELWLKV